MDVLLLWIGLIAATAYFASQKGRHVGNWVVAGIFLAPFTAIALMVLPSKKTDT